MFKGKTAVVTGGSRGIGRAIAEKFASMGADVAMPYVGDPAEAEEAVKACEAYGVKAKAYVCNVADFEESKATIKQIQEDFGTIHILVNNAGINRDKLMMMMKEKDWDDVLNVNLKGTFNMIRHCAGIFVKNKYGRIVNISSVAGIMGNAGQVNYSASKAGVIGVTKSTARELASKNVTCNAIAPGFIQTAMTEKFDSDNPLVASIPAGRMGTPEDVAKVAAFLASDDASYVTGEIIKVDGGIAM